jgi:hypothetical protein
MSLAMLVGWHGVSNTWTGLVMRTYACTALLWVAAAAVRHAREKR